MSKVREVRLKTLTINVSQADIARQCEITPQAVSQAILEQRQIFVTIDDNNKIQKVVEYKDPVRIWNKYN